MLDFSEYQNKTIPDLQESVINENEISEVYDCVYNKIRDNHPIYNKGWQCNFYYPHRYMNWIIYYYIKYNISRNKTIMDIGCYDGLLIKLLRDKEFHIYGYDDNKWEEMWNLLKVKKHIGVKPVYTDIAIMFNYHHNYRPNELFPFIEKVCGNIPDIVFFDRHVETGIHNKLYYNEKLIKDWNLQIVSFPECEKYNYLTKRELMIWKK